MLVAARASFLSESTWVPQLRTGLPGLNERHRTGNVSPEAPLLEHFKTGTRGAQLQLLHKNKRVRLLQNRENARAGARWRRVCGAHQNGTERC
jgi:hypothetical protein